jgi:hypothetical protein
MPVSAAVVADTHTVICTLFEPMRLSAPALRLGLPLVTRDRKIVASGITTIW